MRAKLGRKIHFLRCRIFYRPYPVEYADPARQLVGGVVPQDRELDPGPAQMGHDCLPKISRTSEIFCMDNPTNKYIFKKLYTQSENYIAKNLISSHRPCREDHFRLKCKIVDR
jgi:hypothetical protein